MDDTSLGRAIGLLNKLYAEALGPQRTKNAMLYFEPPKNWPGTVYHFGYTPWRTQDPESGREGFWALKYRVFKNGTEKLVKKVRFGRRKIATARAEKWHAAYYRPDQ